MRQRSFFVAAVAPAAAFVWVLANLGPVLDGEVLTEHVTWVPQLGLDIDLRLDGFAALTVLLVAGLGVAVLAGGLRALRQHDLKLLVAFGTVSQLGFLMVLFGIGTPAAASAGCVMLLAHAVFKAGLFMAVGTVDHHTGTRDLRRIPDLRAGWWPFIAVTLICAASMAGLPLLVGFIGRRPRSSRCSTPRSRAARRRLRWSSPARR